MEDLDTPRCVPGAADDILRTLEAFGLHSDEPVLYQSRRTSAYEKALSKLQASSAVYPCCCTRREIADSALHGIEGLVYPGTCRDVIPAGREGRAWRVRTDCPFGQNQFLPPCRGKVWMGVESWSPNFATPSLALPLQGGGNVGSNEFVGIIDFEDTLQGRITQHLENEIGDFVVKRADGLFAYQLAVVVDDAFQGITHIVRGADLLASTARQIYLQRLLGLTTPAYMHLPVAVNAAGEKLSKQTLAAPVDTSQPVVTLLRVLNFLQQQPPASLADSDLTTVRDWAIQNWDTAKLRGIQRLPAT
ncbi:MAG: glutamyl-Q tRNA(Asp) [Gallionellaceae bacterium]|nr:MAG: glutamyl-Q tRNA(Asp) [Gallionellaceae bacterium]